MKSIRFVRIIILTITVFSFLVGYPFAEYWEPSGGDIINDNSGGSSTGGDVNINGDLSVGAHVNIISSSPGSVEYTNNSGASFEQSDICTYLKSGASPVMNIKPKGAGIGDIDPQAPLHIRTENAPVNGMIIDSDDDLSQDFPIRIRAQGNADLSFSNSDTRFLISTFGQCATGPGTIDPEVSSAYLHVRTGNALAGHGMIIDSDGDNATGNYDIPFMIRTAQNLYEKAPENADTKFMVDGQGKVLIGEPDITSGEIDPLTHDLAVKGDIRLSGQIKSSNVNDQIDVSGDLTFNGASIRSDGSICIGTCP